VVDFIQILFFFDEEHGWWNGLHIIEMDVVVTHGHNGSHGGLEVVSTFYVNHHRKMYQH